MEVLAIRTVRYQHRNGISGLWPINIAAHQATILELHRGVLLKDVGEVGVVNRVEVLDFVRHCGGLGLVLCLSVSCADARRSRAFI